MIIIYGICKSCGKIKSKDETTGTGAGTVDSISYQSIKSKDCGCTGTRKKVDIVEGR